MNYDPNIQLAFNSVEYIMREIHYGWLFRYTHANGASMFFIVVYCHIFRGIYYSSFQAPRQRLWFSGLLIFVIMMATAFMGYVLPWGQMSYWGVTVITNLFSAIPIIGDSIVAWLWGGFSVNNATLNRFQIVHYVLPFIIVLLMITHLNILHQVGSSTPLGIEHKKELDDLDFFPYFVIKDIVALLAYLMVFVYLVCFEPNLLGHPDNYIPADPFKTPAHIVPEWYFLPFYAILRSIPNKLGGVLAMFGAILAFATLPFANRVTVRSPKFRPIYPIFFYFLLINFIFLGYIGHLPVKATFVIVGEHLTFCYFLWFIVRPFINVLESVVTFNIKFNDIKIDYSLNLYGKDHTPHLINYNNKVNTINKEENNNKENINNEIKK